jgi:hypothetical protein
LERPAEVPGGRRIMSLSAMSAEQLSPSEAVSMSALLDDCCEKLAFLGTISPDVNEHKMEESNRIGDEMSRIIAEQRQLEDKFEQLIQQRSELKASSNKKRAEENTEEIKEVARQLKLKTKLLCRNLKVRTATAVPAPPLRLVVCSTSLHSRTSPRAGQPERRGESDEAAGGPKAAGELAAAYDRGVARREL